MEHILLGLAEFVLVLGGIGIFLMVFFFLGLGAACWGICRMFAQTSKKEKASKRKGKELSEIERLRRQLLEAQSIAYESALASEKTIQQLQQKLNALESERAPILVSVRQ